MLNHFGSDPAGRVKKTPEIRLECVEVDGMGRLRAEIERGKGGCHRADTQRWVGFDQSCVETSIHVLVELTENEDGAQHLLLVCVVKRVSFRVLIRWRVHETGHPLHAVN